MKKSKPNFFACLLKGLGHILKRFWHSEIRETPNTKVRHVRKKKDEAAPIKKVDPVAKSRPRIQKPKRTVKAVQKSPTKSANRKKCDSTVGKGKKDGEKSGGKQRRGVQKRS